MIIIFFKKKSQPSNPISKRQLHVEHGYSQNGMDNRLRILYTKTQDQYQIDGQNKAHWARLNLSVLFQRDPGSGSSSLEDRL
jgi:hypothetical protein